MKLLVTYWVWALVAVALLSCNTNTDTVAPVAKISANDPFKNSIVPTQEFTVDAKTDNVVQGNNGTVLVLPQGCFVDADGKPVEGNIKVELAEALKVEDMLASNLTTTANGQLLQTDGMIYFNATANGQQLTVNKDNPVYIEIPTPKKQPDMMVYSGTRDSLGNMTWKNPRKPENYLVTVDLDKLDFLPHGFADSVANNMPFRKYRKATDKLTDSLYYSLSGKSQYDFIDMDKFWKDLFKEFNVNEPLLTEPVKRDSTRIAEPAKGYDEQGGEGHGSHGPSDWECGIDPAIIKTLKSPQYKNTLIATREFETRLKVLFKTCKKGVIDLYFNNLDKNMYEIDSMAAIKLAGTPYESDFITFKNLRSGKVKNGDKHSKLLQGFYERKLKEVKDKLEEANNKFKEEVKKTTADIEAVKNDYKEVLVKRESYRMETYGFIATETGWINIDNGTIEKDWAPQTMELFVEGGKGYERTYGYVIFTSIKSLVRFNTGDKETFYSGTDGDRYMNMPKNKPAVAIAVAYKGDQLFFTVKDFMLGTDSKVVLKPESGKMTALKAALRPYDKYLPENRIDQDLYNLEKLYKQELKGKKLIKENELMLKLWYVAYPCCGRDRPAAAHGGEQ